MIACVRDRFTSASAVLSLALMCVASTATADSITITNPNPNSNPPELWVSGNTTNASATIAGNPITTTKVLVTIVKKDTPSIEYFSSEGTVSGTSFSLNASVPNLLPNDPDVVTCTITFQGKDANGNNTASASTDLRISKTGSSPSANLAEYSPKAVREDEEWAALEDPYAGPYYTLVIPDALSFKGGAAPPEVGGWFGNRAIMNRRSELLT